jgi:hypothetical protein
MWLAFKAVCLYPQLSCFHSTGAYKVTRRASRRKIWFSFSANSWIPARGFFSGDALVRRKLLYRWPADGCVHDPPRQVCFASGHKPDSPLEQADRQPILNHFLENSFLGKRIEEFVGSSSFKSANISTRAEWNCGFYRALTLLLRATLAMVLAEYRVARFVTTPWYVRWVTFQPTPPDADDVFLSNLSYPWSFP